MVFKFTVKPILFNNKFIYLYYSCKHSIVILCTSEDSGLPQKGLTKLVMKEYWNCYFSMLIYNVFKRKTIKTQIVIVGGFSITIYMQG